MKPIFTILWCYILIVPVVPVHSQALHTRLENQISGWGILGFRSPANYQFGGRYLPTLNLTDSLKDQRLIDAEFSINGFANASFNGTKYDDGSAVLKPYRLWVRYATPRFEIRIGLQKINFGSATILRPLMWFDKIDYRDPLQLTDGVTGALGRYYFQNNANIWLWMLAGSNKTRGWETVPGRKDTPEFGGRFQHPFGKGEAAISYNHRTAGFIPSSDTIPLMNLARYPEDKIGLDGKWDLGLGLWLETTLKHNNLRNPVIPEWETFLNLGIDYTFSLGNGLNMTAEYFRYNRKKELTSTGLHNTFMAIAAGYPFGIMNTLSASVYYNWDQKEWYRFINLQRKYDYWSFYLMVFWNPNNFVLYNAKRDRNLFAGKGMQLMAVVNF